MKFKIRNTRPFQPGRSRLKAPEYLTLEVLPSGKLDACEDVGYVPIPRRPTEMICDCCLNRTDRLWAKPHYGFCMGFPNAGRERKIVLEGVWAFCVYCWPLFERREIELLVARVATLNPDLNPHQIRAAYGILAQVIHGETVAWESGQDRAVMGGMENEGL